MMPTSSNGLTHKSCTCEALGILTLLELLSCEPVAVGRKTAVSVGLLEPRLTKQTSFKSGKLSIYRPRQTNVVSIITYDT